LATFISDVGTIASIDSDGDVRVQFAGRDGLWCGKPSELEQVAGPPTRTSSVVIR